MPHLLSRLKILEVSSVDRGAGNGVRVLLMKRMEKGAGICKECGGDGTHLAKCSSFGKVASLSQSPDYDGDEDDYDANGKPLPDRVSKYLKREFTQAERDADAKSGAAMPGGGFPIKTAADLENAIQAIGRAKNPAAAKVHIKERARALGLSDKVPDTWGKVDTRDRAEILADVISVSATAMMPYGANADAVNKAANAIVLVLKGSGDDTLIEKSLNQYVEHVTGLVPTDKRDAFLAAIAASSIAKGDLDMDATELKKAIDAAIAPLSAQLAKLETENAILKMSPEHREVYGRIEKAEDQAAFIKADDKQRVELAKAAPPKKGVKPDPDEDDIDKKVAKLISESPVMKKLADDLATAQGVIKSMTGESQVASFAKRAEDLGLPAAAGETIRKAYAGDVDAQTKMDGLLKGLVSQTDTAALFSEFGKASDGGGTGATAYQAIRAKAAELVKAEAAAGRVISIHQGVDKVLRDPANADLAKRNKEEEMRKRAA